MKHEPGTYVIVLKSFISQKSIPIGKHKYLLLEPGFYYYVGSAFGAGGVKSRVSHHLNISKKPRWHLDFLRKHAEVVEVWHTYDDKKREHQWANIFQSNSLTTIPLLGFGSSDCQCASHLFFCNTPLKVTFFTTLVKKTYQQHKSIYCYTLAFY